MIELQRRRLYKKPLVLTSLDQARTLPSSVTYVRINGLGDEAAIELSRHPQLRAIVLSTGHGISDRAVQPLQNLPQLVRLDLSSSEITDGAIKELARMPMLAALELNHCKGVSLEGLAALSTLPHLKSLSLSEPHHLSPQGMTVLARITNLEQLQCFFLTQGLGDQALEILSGLTSLRNLLIGEWRLTGSGLRSLARKTKIERLILAQCTSLEQSSFKYLLEAPNLQQLRLDQPDGLRAKGMKLISRLPSLQGLTLSGCKNVDDGCLSYIEGAGKLEALVLSNCPVTDKGLAQLGRLSLLTSLDVSSTDVRGFAMEAIGTLRALKELDLSWNENLNNSMLESIASLESLEGLNLAETYISDKGLAHISRLRGLKALSLHGCERVTRNGIGVLSQISGLELLDLRECAGICQEVIQELAHALPACKVVSEESYECWMHPDPQNPLELGL